MTKADANVLRCARLYVRYGSRAATERTLKLFKYWEGRLHQSAVKLHVEDERKAGA